MDVFSATGLGLPEPVFVATGTDRSGEHRGLGISRIEFKVTAADAASLFVLENIFHSPGGPPKHLHFDQDEWFFCLEGEFLMEVGERSIAMRPGDSLLAPRRVPHVWASVGQGTGRMLVSFAPPGLMEEFFRKVTAHDAMPPQNPELWRSHGMELLGPPMSVFPSNGDQLQTRS